MIAHLLLDRGADIEAPQQAGSAPCTRPPTAMTQRWWRCSSTAGRPGGRHRRRAHGARPGLDPAVIALLP
ncbi:MAG: hypothetical protein R2711_10060 [Acidimicrobiales bacterium]